MHMLTINISVGQLVSFAMGQLDITPCNVMKGNIFNSIQCNSIQFNSIQFNSIQFNSIQFNSILFVFFSQYI